MSPTARVNSEGTASCENASIASPSRSDVATDVVVTGLGAHSTFGSVASAWAALQRGESAVASHEMPGARGLGLVLGAPAPAPSDDELFGAGKLAKYMSPTTRFAVVAAGRALEDAGLLHDAVAKRDMGLFAATGRIAFDLSDVERAIELSRDEEGRFDGQRFGREGMRACHPLLPFKMLLNMPLGLVSIVFGIRGPNAILYPDAAQGGACFETAIRRIQKGEIRAALVGGVQQGFSVFPLAMQSANRGIATSLNRVAPYRQTHAGLAPADAAAFVVLESAEAAYARGARPYARVVAATIAHGLDEPEEDMHARIRAWSAAFGGERPDTAICAGANDWDEDRRELAILNSTWPEQRGHALNFDGQSGDMGPASPAWGVALAAWMLKTGCWLTMKGPVDTEVCAGFCPAVDGSTRFVGSTPSSVVTVARTADGSSSAIMLRKAAS